MKVSHKGPLSSIMTPPWLETKGMQMSDRNGAPPATPRPALCVCSGECALSSLSGAAVISFATWPCALEYCLLFHSSSVLPCFTFPPAFCFLWTGGVSLSLSSIPTGSSLFPSSWGFPALRLLAHRGLRTRLGRWKDSPPDGTLWTTWHKAERNG